MTKKKKSPVRKPTEGSITVGDITSSEAVAIGHGARATHIQSGSLPNDEVARIFAMLAQKVNAMPDGLEKGVARNAVEGLKAEAKKGEKADESHVRKWFGFLAETTKDALDVAVDTFSNPIKGLGTAFQKVAEKAKAEREAKT